MARRFADGWGELVQKVATGGAGVGSGRGIGSASTGFRDWLRDVQMDVGSTCSKVAAGVASVGS